LGDAAFDTFERCFINVIRKGGGAITTKTASEIATSLAVGLISPITAQIDPLRVGEVERAINIANEYGTRLNASQEKVHALIHHYPSHSFVIDYDEACDLFKNVRRPTALETSLEQLLQEIKDDEGRRYIRSPDKKGWMAYLKPQTENENEPEQQETGETSDAASGAAVAPPTGAGEQHNGGGGRTHPAEAGQAPGTRQSDSGDRDDGTQQRASSQAN
jgi:hypothetical protein